jgi:hypothetical protein
MSDYQKRTAERLIEILRSSDQNPRSWNQEAADEIERLRKGIQDYLGGNYENPRKCRGIGSGKCSHGFYWYEACEECVDAHFTAILSPAQRPDVEKTGEGQS